MLVLTTLALWMLTQGISYFPLYPLLPRHTGFFLGEKSPGLELAEDQGMWARLALFAHAKSKLVPSSHKKHMQDAVSHCYLKPKASERVVSPGHLGICCFWDTNGESSAGKVLNYEKEATLPQMSSEAFLVTAKFLLFPPLNVSHASKTSGSKQCSLTRKLLQPT